MITNRFDTTDARVETISLDETMAGLLDGKYEDVILTSPLAPPIEPNPVWKPPWDESAEFNPMAGYCDPDAGKQTITDNEKYKCGDWWGDKSIEGLRATYGSYWCRLPNCVDCQQKRAKIMLAKFKRHEGKHFLTFSSVDDPKLRKATRRIGQANYARCVASNGGVILVNTTGEGEELTDEMLTSEYWEEAIKNKHDTLKWTGRLSGSRKTESEWEEKPTGKEKEEEKPETQKWLIGYTKTFLLDQSEGKKPLLSTYVNEAFEVELMNPANDLTTQAGMQAYIIRVMRLEREILLACGEKFRSIKSSEMVDAQKMVKNALWLKKHPSIVHCWYSKDALANYVTQRETTINAFAWAAMSPWERNEAEKTH